MVLAKESLMIKSVYGSFKRISEIRVMAYFMIIHTLYWFCGVFIYGVASSSCCGFYCDFNASLGNASMLINVGFDGLPTVYTASFITVRGTVYYIKWLSSIR